MVRNMGQMMDLHEDSPYKTLAVRKSHHLMLHSVVFLSIFLSLQAMSCDDVKYLRHAAAWQLADIAVLSIFVLPARAFFFFFFYRSWTVQEQFRWLDGSPPIHLTKLGLQLFLSPHHVLRTLVNTMVSFARTRIRIPFALAYKLPHSMLITLVIHIRPFLDPLEYLIFMAHQHLAESRCRRLDKLAVAFRRFPTFKSAAPYAVRVRDEYL